MKGRHETTTMNFLWFYFGKSIGIAVRRSNPWFYCVMQMQNAMFVENVLTNNFDFLANYSDPFRIGICVLYRLHNHSHTHICEWWKKKIEARKIKWWHDDVYSRIDATIKRIFSMYYKIVYFDFPVSNGDLLELTLTHQFPNKNLLNLVGTNMTDIIVIYFAII